MRIDEGAAPTVLRAALGTHRAGRESSRRAGGRQPGGIGRGESKKATGVAPCGVSHGLRVYERATLQN